MWDGNERRKTYSGQRRQLFDRRRKNVRLSISVDPSHLEALDGALVLLDELLAGHIDARRLKAASGDREAMHAIDRMRATQRYIGELSGGISAAQEFISSQETNEGKDNAEAKN